MSKFLIVNADDFGYSYGINEGIRKAHVDGIVTSTSVLVDGVAANEARDLTKYKNLSIGLHFALTDVTNVQSEFERQVEMFSEIIGRAPDHVDTHKRQTTDDGIREVLMTYSRKYKTPVRQFHTLHIGSFGVRSSNASVDQLKISINEVTDGFNELMCHVGYVDDYLREHSSYSDPRGQELASICDPGIKEYIREQDIKLINWRQITQ